MTSSLIHILRITQASWSQDLQQNKHISPSSSTPSQVGVATTPTAATSTAELLRTHQRTASGRMIKMAASGEELDGGGGGGVEERKVSTIEKGLALLHSVRFVSQTRQRMKFVPFLLRNNTGLPLKFATLTSVPSKVHHVFWSVHLKSPAFPPLLGVCQCICPAAPEDQNIWCGWGKGCGQQDIRVDGCGVGRREAI